MRTAIRIALILAFEALFFAPALASGAEKNLDPVAETATQDALATFEKDWKDYTNEPNYGDPRWKLKMETLVRLTKAGPVALPLLDEAAKEVSSWRPHTRDLAAEILRVLRGPAAVREALASYDLSQMDTAGVGKPAPDFTLADASGQTYRLSQFRGKKAVVLTFIIQDI